MGGGAVVIVLAVSLFSPRLVPPLAAIAGWPLERLRRLLGRLARENAQRNPSRTAVTAAALMIGLALVAFVTVFAAGLKSSVAQVVDENFAGGLVIQNSDGFSPIPNGDRRRRPQGPRRGAGRDDPLGPGEAGRQRRRRPRLGADPATSNEARQGRMEAGRAGRPCATSPTTRRSSPTRSPPNTTSKSATASACSARPGKRPSFEVAGEFSSKLGVFGSVLITQAALARDFGQTQDTIDFVKTDAGCGRRPRSRRC